MRALLGLTLLREEARRLWRVRALRMLCLLAPLLLLLTFLSTWSGAARLAQEKNGFSAAERSRWVEQGDKDPHSAAHFGVWAVKPASPLATLAPGIEPYVGLAVWLEAHKRNEMIFRPSQEAHPVTRGGASVGQLLELLGPLFALLLGYTAFARDRQNGSLRMAFGNGASPVRMLTARMMLTGSLLLACLVLPAAALGAAALLALPAGGWDGALRLAAWSVLQFAYLLVFLLFALAISLRVASARLALALLLGLWVVLCVLVPRGAGTLVQQLAPAPSYQQVRQHTEAAAPAYESADRWEARRRSLLEQAAGRPIDLRAAQLDQSERESHAVFDRLLGSFYDAIAYQDRVHGWLAGLSPTVALQSAGAAFAGTDFHHHRHFIDAAEHYRRELVNDLNGVLMHHAGQGGPLVTGRAFWESVQEFRYRPPPLSAAAGAVAVSLLLLLAWCTLAFIAAWAAVRGGRP